jgi:hypothetical protein
MLIGSTISLNTMMLGSTSFTPATLFSRGEQGVWLDPSELGTMFQDRAGTTPVTTPGQLVGLRLDKSQQLALGPELLGNPSFTSSANYSLLAGATISGGQLFIDNQANSRAEGTGNFLPAGKLLLLEIDIASTTGAVGVILADAVGSLNIDAGTFSAAGVFRRYVQSSNTNGNFRIIRNTGATVLNSISFKEVAGNHATAVSDATRGTYGIEPYGGRRNLHTWTQEFENAAWTNVVGPKPTVTVNATVAPDGTLTADLLNFSSQYQAVNQGNRDVGVVYTESVWMRVDSGTRTINLTTNTGAILGTFTVTSSWQRFSATYTASASTAGWQDRNASGFVGVYIWGAQLEIVPTATTILSPYQRVTDQWNVTEAGVPTVHYLEYDNVAYVTPTIDPSLNPPLGPELITNGDFATDTDWSKGSGWAIGGGVASCDGSTQFSQLTQTNVAPIGRNFRVSFTLVSRGASVTNLRVVLGGVFVGQLDVSSAGTYSGYFLNSGSSSAFSLQTQAGTGAGFAVTIDNVSVQELVTDEVQVFAGVRKLSDAAVGLLLETSINSSANNGTVAVFAPAGAATANYSFRSKGTAESIPVSPSNYPAPISNVFTGLGDISADVSILRVNSTQVATSSTDQGTGSYGAYPLYIGARGGSSLFFRGRDYGIIVRFGPNLSNTMILDTEEWLGNKTGVLYVLWNGVWQDQYTWVDNLNWNDGV